MNTILKIVLVIGAISGVGTLLGSLIPQQLTTNINNGIIYFLNYINYLQPILPVDSIFIILKILINFIFAIAIFKIIIGLIHLLTK